MISHCVKQQLLLHCSSSVVYICPAGQVTNYSIRIAIYKFQYLKIQLGKKFKNSLEGNNKPFPLSLCGCMWNVYCTRVSDYTRHTCEDYSFTAYTCKELLVMMSPCVEQLTSCFFIVLLLLCTCLYLLDVLVQSEYIIIIYYPSSFSTNPALI